MIHGVSGFTHVVITAKQKFHPFFTHNGIEVSEVAYSTYFTIRSSSFNKLGPNIKRSTGLLHVIGVLHFLPYNILKGLSFG